MNKFILVPKEQFENLKENQISESGGSMISEIRLDTKNESPIEGKETKEGDKIIKKQGPPPEGDKNIKRQDPPPGLPNHYLGVDKPNIEIEQSRLPVEEEVETGIQNGSDSGTKISDEENDYLKDIYYNPQSPFAFS